MKMVLHHLAYPVSALGPGLRVVLWMAGCRQHCKGCIAPQLQNPESGKIIAVDRLLRHILGLTLPLDGITVTGGEPFDQALVLAQFLGKLKQERPDWNCLLFSGYTLAALEHTVTMNGLLQFADILVDGPFQDNLAADHPLAGSKNQMVHYLTKRGAGLRRVIENDRADRADLGLGSDRKHMLIGIVNAKERSQLHELLGLRPDISEGMRHG